MTVPVTLRWHDQRLFIIDQTQLPAQLVEQEQHNAEQVFDAILQLKVRGAPAIGVAAAYGLVLELKAHLALSQSQFQSKIASVADYLDSSRPTAVNLGWALRRMVKTAKDNAELDNQALLARLETEAIAIHHEDRQICQDIGRHGVELIKPGMGILTHCNAGALATSGLGTALAPLYLAHQAGVAFKVYADETRPLLQGARLTAWELSRAGIDVTLNTDNMTAYLMQQGLIDMVIVGTDRVVANGDVANKIGTLGVAILAKHFAIPFYVACPSSTIDLSTATGADIEIEQRQRHEVTHIQGVQTAPMDVNIANPAFDVTPSELVTAIITERGIIQQPIAQNLKAMFAQ